jgi:hypothetical protein
MVIMDEFNEPMHYMSVPVKIKKEHLFDNELNLDMQDVNSEAEVLSIEYESPINKQNNKKLDFNSNGNLPEVVFKMQMSYKPDEDYTYITNALMKLSLGMIN